MSLQWNGYFWDRWFPVQTISCFILFFTAELFKETAHKRILSLTDAWQGETGTEDWESWFASVVRSPKQMAAGELKMELKIQELDVHALPRCSVTQFAASYTDCLLWLQFTLTCQFSASTHNIHKHFPQEWRNWTEPLYCCYCRQLTFLLSGADSLNQQLQCGLNTGDIVPDRERGGMDGAERGERHMEREGGKKEKEPAVNMFTLWNCGKKTDRRPRGIA